MDLKAFISEMQKIRIINGYFQIKLGELTLTINNNPQYITSTAKETILLFIKTLQSFLCHNFYNDYVNSKTKEKSNIMVNNVNSIPDDSKENFGSSNINFSNTFQNNQFSVYDNCMNLILVILAKIAKLNNKYAASMVDSFVEHLKSHHDCFNYIISFYRIYINSSVIKSEAKNLGLYNNLFDLYKKIYLISLKLETNENPQNFKCLKNIFPLQGAHANLGNWSLLMKNFIQKKEINEEAGTSSRQVSKRLRNTNDGNFMVKNKLSLINSYKFGSLSIERNSEVMGHSPDYSERKLHPSGQRINNKQNENIDSRGEIRHIPHLKLEFNNIFNNSDKIKNLHQSITRSSRRNEFSRGGSTNHTGNLREKNLISKRYLQEEIQKKEIIIDGSTSNKNSELDEKVFPKETLKKLALQLGESCLAVDLASLINHKREIELNRIARNYSFKNENSQLRDSSNPDYINKLKSSFDSDEEDFNPKKNLIEQGGQSKLASLLNKKPLINDRVDPNNLNVNKLSNSISQRGDILDITKDIKKNFVFSFDNQNFGSQVDKIYRNYIKIREIISNFILSCINEYTIEEMSFIKININLIYSFLLLPSFDIFRRRLERKKFESLENMHDFSGDYKNYISEGSFSVMDKENIKFSLLNSTESQNEETIKKDIKPNLGIREKMYSIDSILSYKEDDEKYYSLVLKSEYEALNEILSFDSHVMEHLFKSANFFKNLFRSLDNPDPEKIEFWYDGILFNSFNKVRIENLRKSSDSILERAKNKVYFILKYFNLNTNNFNEKNNNELVILTLKQQLDLLKEYLNSSKSKIMPIHSTFELCEILIILKRKLIDLLIDIGPFENQNEFKLIEKLDYSDIYIPDSLLNLFIGFIEILTSIISYTQNFSCEKLLNDIFIKCPYFLEVQKFVVIYIFTKELLDSNKSKTQENLKYNLISLLHETQSGTGSQSVSFNMSKLIEIYKERLRMGIAMVNFKFSITTFYQRIVRQENLGKIKHEEKDLNKYWLMSIRDYFHYLNYFVNPKFGIFFKYLSIYGSFIKLHYGVSFQSDKTNNYGFSAEKQIPIINFALTRALLNFQNSIFQFSSRFSLVVNENSSLDFIRFHYISFIKLYNKNMDLKAKLGDINKLLENCDPSSKKKKVKVLIRDIYNDQSNLQVIINLCKLHLMCLFSLSKNRNNDVTNKFFQLRIVDFMVKELDLEHEAAEKLYKAKNYMNRSSTKSPDVINSSNSNKNSPKLNMNFSGFSLDMNNSENIHQKRNSFKGISPKTPTKDQRKESTIFKYLPKQETVLEEGDEESKYSKNISNCEDKSSIKMSMVQEDLSAGNNKSAKNIIIEELDIVRVENKDEDKNSEKSNEDESFDSDLSDVMLVDLKPKVNVYEKIIPKLSFIPTTLSETSLGGQVPQQNKPITKINSDQLKKDVSQDKNINPALKLEISNSNQQSITPPHTNSRSILKSLSNSAIKPENVLVDLNEDPQNLSKLVNSESLSMTNNFTNSIKMEQNKITSILDNNIIHNSKMKPTNKPDKFNLKLKETKDESQNIDVINYSGNQGKITFEKIPKLDMRNVNQPNRENRKNTIEDINLVNVDHPIPKTVNQENLEKTLNDQKVNKIQLAFENMLKKKYKLFYRKATLEELKEEDLSNFNLFYMKERNNRLLYHDSELQALIISLIISLIITPTRGTLEELYCNYYPSYESNKINVLFILHHHLNHAENQQVIPHILRIVSEISPLGAGQRLLKLLCISLFDTSIYRDWQKIASGAYGQVFQCATNFAEPSTVAVKKISKAENIYDFCHLFDILTEITALETFRMEGCVTHLFDYGVDQEYYYIVMKKYQMSLKEWRNKQLHSLNEMLQVYLNIFKDILKAVHTIHSHNTTHYDLKCDNVVIDINQYFQPPNSQVSSEDIENTFSVKIADFGECKIFLSEKDEFCVRSRGTNVIKSPEMLKNYGFQVRVDDDNYDRRRRMATTRSSDIWSLGCLFYELLTGKFLFEEIETDYFGFMYKANTLSISELLTNEKLKELNHNQYLIDFLKFMLVKDQNHRPNIETIMNRFEHVHALLVNIGGTVNASQNLLTKRSFGGNIENSLEICESLISYNKNSPNYLLKSDYNHKLKWIPQMMKLTAEIFLADISWGENNFEKLQKLHITHIVSCTKPRNRNYEKFLFLNILEDTNDIGTSTFSCLFKVMDFLRHCMIYRGSVLFLDDFQYMNIPGKPNVLIRGIILLCFSFMLNLSVYDTWTYLNSKILFLSIPPDILSELSNWVFHQNIVNSFTYSHPYMRCLCGACGVVFKKSYLDVTNLHTKKCLCSQKQNTNFYSECPSSGCLEYMQDMKNSYSLNYDCLEWATFTSEDFLIGPKELTFSPQSKYLKKVVSFSRGLDENMLQHSLNEKKSLKLTSKKTYWYLYKCRICQVWIYGENSDRYLVLLNNSYNFEKKVEQKKTLIKSSHLSNLKLSKLL